MIKKTFNQAFLILDNSYLKIFISLASITFLLLNASEKGATWMTEKGAKKIVLIKPIFRVLDSK